MPCAISAVCNAEHLQPGLQHSLYMHVHADPLGLDASLSNRLAGGQTSDSMPAHPADRDSSPEQLGRDPGSPC